MVVHVQHYLNEAGRAYFPAWISEVAEVLCDFEGFGALSQLTDVQDENACHLLLTFESLPLLRAWSRSEAHDKLIAKLEPYQHKKQTSEVFEKHPDV